MCEYDTASLKHRIGRFIANTTFWASLPLLLLDVWVDTTWTTKLFWSDIVAFFFGLILYAITKEGTL